MASKNSSYKLTSEKITRRVKNAILLAGASLALSIPVFLHNYEHYTNKIFEKMPTPQQIQLLAVGQSLIVFCAVIICALVGLLYKDKLGLPGIGQKKDFKKWVPLCFGFGILFAPALYVFSDAAIFPHLPGLYPKNFLWALSYAAGNALNEEIVGRLGLLTIAVYFINLRNQDGRTDTAVLIISIILAFSSLLFLNRLELIGDLTPYQIIKILLVKFVINMVYGEVYIKKGLVPTLFLHLGVNSRIVLYSIIG